MSFIFQPVRSLVFTKDGQQQSVVEKPWRDHKWSEEVYFFLLNKQTIHFHAYILYICNERNFKIIFFNITYIRFLQK